MMLPLILAAAGAFQQGQMQTEWVAQPVRLQLTPTIDGKIDKDEWDPYAPSTYLEWEPGKIYVAANLPPGKFLVLSMDADKNGWFHGRDNYEFRIEVKEGKASITARELDATAVREPVWRPRPDLEAASRALAGPNGDVEAVLDDAGLGLFPRAPKTVWVRLDMLQGTPGNYDRDSRWFTNIYFDDHRAAALPKGMDSGVEARSRAVVPGESVALRMTFHGNEKLGAKSIELRTLGEAENSANRMSIPFPGFDDKGRAFVDYRSRIDPDASMGYRVVRGTVTFKDGPAGVVEASYRIAPLMGFTLLRPEFARLPDDNVLRVRYLLQLFTRQAADGSVRISAPAGWQVLKGDGQKFRLLGNQSAEERSFEIKAPNDAHGTFPVKFTGQTKDRTVEQVCYITIR